MAVPIKRCCDFVGATVGLLLLWPVFACIAVAIKLSDRGPAFYRQERVGQNGKSFWILKFRTMIVAADKMGPWVTRRGDPRTTKVGRVLRRAKLDELPQLVNVLLGDMSFVGPRPEVPKYVVHYTPEQREILKFKPGITDPASILFLDEESLLKGVADVEAFYLRHCVPIKVALNLEYSRRATVLSDLALVMRTVFLLLRIIPKPKCVDPLRLRPPGHPGDELLGKAPV